MSQLSGPMGRPPKPRSNIYTVLALVTLLVLAVGVGVLYWANTDMTGESNPLFLFKLK